MTETYIPYLRQVVTALGGVPTVADHEHTLWAKAVRAVGRTASPSLTIYQLIRELCIHYGIATSSADNQVAFIRALITHFGGTWSHSQDRPVLIRTLSSVV